MRRLLLGAFPRARRRGVFLPAFTAGVSPPASGGHLPWTRPESNRPPPACDTGALPDELRAQDRAAVRTRRGTRTPNLRSLSAAPRTYWASRAWWTTAVSNRARAACKAALRTCASPMTSQRPVLNRLPPGYESGAPPVVLRWRVSRRPVSNRLPAAYKAAARPGELRRPECPRRDSNAHHRRPQRRASASWATRAWGAAGGGFEPPPSGPEPDVLPDYTSPHRGRRVARPAGRFSAGTAQPTSGPPGWSATASAPRTGSGPPCAGCSRRRRPRC